MNNDMRDGEKKLFEERNRMGNSGEYAILRKRKDDKEKPKVDENSKRSDKSK